MLEKKKAVIFDLDGTLVDSMWMWKSIDIEFLEARNLSYPEKLQDEIEGMSFSETIRYFKNRFHLPDPEEKLQEILNHMALDKYRYEVPLKDGAKNFLQYLKENNIKTGIATSNSRFLLEAVSKAHNLTNYIDCFLTADDVKKGKPAPDVFLTAAQKLSIHPKDCLVFEDIPNGIVAGKSAGMEVCAIEDAFSYDMIDKKKKLADFYIKSYDQVLNQTYEVLK